MNKYNTKVKIAAMQKTAYSSKKIKINNDLSKNKKNAIELKKGRDSIKKNMEKVIGKVELYHKLYKDLEVILSGLNETNVNLQVKETIDNVNNVIDKYIPSNMKTKFLKIKGDLEELSKLTNLDIYKMKDEILVVAKNKIYNNILDEAEKIYKTIYIPVSKSKVKKSYTKGEIAKYLRNKNSFRKLKSFTKKLTRVSKVIDKVDKVIKMSKRAIKVFDSYAKGDALSQQQDRLKTAKDYKEYYYKVAQEASKIASVLKYYSYKLPPGMREYYEFIFTVAENTDKMAKVVYDYTGRLEKAMAELDKDSKSRGEKNSHFNDGGVPADVTKYPNDHSNSYLQ